jgi:hypothetical protein
VVGRLREGDGRRQGSGDDAPRRDDDDADDHDDHDDRMPLPSLPEVARVPRS